MDMDGTILDLHFDNHFWLTYFPIKYSEKHNISVEEANEILGVYFHKLAGEIEWYCLDYWTELTEMPVATMKRELQHLIQLRADADNFLTALKQSGREVILVTNAHPDALSLKIERTQLDKYFDALYSTHEFGVVKESQLLWQRLQAKQPFKPENTLFIDDSITILKSAQTFGIKHLLAVANPDSKKEPNIITEFPAITNYDVLLADILANPIS